MSKNNHFLRLLAGRFRKTTTYDACEENFLFSFKAIPELKKKNKKIAIWGGIYHKKKEIEFRILFRGPVEFVY